MMPIIQFMHSLACISGHISTSYNICLFFSNWVLEKNNYKPRSLKIFVNFIERVKLTFEVSLVGFYSFKNAFQVVRKVALRFLRIQLCNKIMSLLLTFFTELSLGLGWPVSSMIIFDSHESQRINL